MLCSVVIPKTLPKQEIKYYLGMAPPTNIDKSSFLSLLASVHLKYYLHEIVAYNVIGHCKYTPNKYVRIDFRKLKQWH